MPDLWRDKEQARDGDVEEFLEANATAASAPSSQPATGGHSDPGLAEMTLVLGTILAEAHAREASRGR